jgi:hypothetical protein
VRAKAYAMNARPKEITPAGLPMLLPVAKSGSSMGNPAGVGVVALQGAVTQTLESVRDQLQLVAG